MKLHQLRYLVSVASEGGVRAGARALGVSQATVTQGLRELEAQAGIALLDRQGGGLALTAAGRELLEHARRMLAQMQQAQDALARHKGGGPQQRLAVGVTPWVAQTLVPRMLPALRAELPHVQLELHDGFTGLVLPKLREGSLDLAICRIGPQATMQGLQAQPLFTYELTVAARRSHPRAGAQSMAQLLQDDWVLNWGPGEREPLLHNLFGRHGLEPPASRIHQVQSAWLMLTLVRKSDVLTWCPWPLLETEDLRDSLVALPLRERFDANTVGIVRRARETPSFAAARFMELFLREVRSAAASEDPLLRRLFWTIDLLDMA